MYSFRRARDQEHTAEIKRSKYALEAAYI